MTPSPPPGATPSAHTASPWKLIFRIIRYTVYAIALVSILLILHKTPPPPVSVDPQAAASAEQKVEQVETALQSGQPATLRMDESELNSYLATHLFGTSDTAGSEADQVEQAKSNVRDVKVQLVDDRVRAYIVFNFHGKDMSLQLEGRLASRNGYLQFDPVSGQLGSFPIPESSLKSAVHRLMTSPENREKLRLPPEVSALRIENGQVVLDYK
jgi:hypothetical protein